MLAPAAGFFLFLVVGAVIYLETEPGLETFNDAY